MFMFIEIDCDAETKFVSDSLFESVQMMYETIEELSELDGDLPHYKQEDLDDALRDIEGLKLAYKYYTVSSMWSKLDQFDLATLAAELEGETESLDLLISASDL